MSERIYFRIGARSPVMGVVRAAEQREATFRKAAKDMQKKFPGCSIWTLNDSVIFGVAFPANSPLPEGWRKGPKCAVPDRRIKAGRELQKRLEALPRGVDGRCFSDMMSAALGASYTHYGDHTISWTTCQKWGGIYVLSVPSGCKATPPGCAELKMSEYWKLREKAKA